MNYLYPAINRSLSLFLLQFKSHVVHNTQFSLKTCIKNFDQPIRTICLSSIRNLEDAEAQENEEEKINPIILRHPERDRRRVISVETSIRYLKSAAFKESYGDKPVWVLYRRNHKGIFPPSKTRKLCIRDNVIRTGNPCPICRDEYLIVHYTNLDLLKHFISPTTGRIIDYQKTGVCQKQHQNLLVAYEQARDLGYITFDVPHRDYDYAEYAPK